MPNPEAQTMSLVDLIVAKVTGRLLCMQTDIENTALYIPCGLFQLRRMPFRLVNAEASYGRMMRILLNGLSGVDNYVDDIVVYTHMWSDQLSILREVFKRLMSAGITVKPSTCCLGYSKIYFVGHKVGEGQLMAQAHRVERVQEAPVPQTVTGILQEMYPQMRLLHPF